MIMIYQEEIERRELLFLRTNKKEEAITSSNTIIFWLIVVYAKGIRNGKGIWYLISTSDNY